MNLSKQVKNMGMVTALGAATIMSSTALNAATMSFLEGDQLVNPGDTFVLTLAAQDLIGLTYSGGLGITFDSTIVEVASSTYDAHWNFADPVNTSTPGQLELNALRVDFGAPVEVNTVEQGMLSIEFNVLAGASGSFDFGFYALDRGVGPWVYTPPFVAAAEGDLAYCLTFDNVDCVDNDGFTAGTSNIVEIDPATGLQVTRETILLSSSSVTVVPVPAAAWLFGSGLIGLVAVSRRKTA